MSDEQEEKLKERIANAKNAESILVGINPYLTQIRAELFKQFKGSKSKDADLRDEVWRKMQAVDWLESSIERWVREGTIAEKKLLDRIKERIKGNTNT